MYESRTTTSQQRISNHERTSVLRELLFVSLPPPHKIVVMIPCTIRVHRYRGVHITSRTKKNKNESSFAAPKPTAMLTARDTRLATNNRPQTIFPSTLTHTTLLLLLRSSFLPLCRIFDGARVSYARLVACSGSDAGDQSIDCVDIDLFDQASGSTDRLSKQAYVRTCNNK